MADGWKCPNCGKAHAPDVKTCPEVAAWTAVAYPIWFYDPPRKEYDPLNSGTGNWVPRIEWTS